MLRKSELALNFEIWSLVVTITAVGWRSFCSEKAAGTLPGLPGGHFPVLNEMSLWLPLTSSLALNYTCTDGRYCTQGKECGSLEKTGGEWEATLSVPCFCSGMAVSPLQTLAAWVPLARCTFLT